MLKHILINVQMHTLALSQHRFRLPSSICCWYVYVLDDNVSGEWIHILIHAYYRIAGNFHGCKFSRKCLQTLQKKISWFLFSWGVPAVPHPWYVRTYTTSRDTRWVKNFVVFIFAVPCGQRNRENLHPTKIFHAIWYYCAHTPTHTYTHTYTHTHTHTHMYSW